MVLLVFYAALDAIPMKTQKKKTAYIQEVFMVVLCSARGVRVRAPPTKSSQEKALRPHKTYRFLARPVAHAAEI